MKISAIQPSYVNRFSFRNNNQQTVTTTQTPVENKNNGLSKNTQTAIGLGAGIVVLAGLVYAGYTGKLGAKIQKFLGGVKKEAAKATENLGAEVKPKDSSLKTPKSEAPAGTAEVESVKIDTDEAKSKKDILNGIDAEDAEVVEEIPYKLTAAELQNLPHEQSFAKFKDDINTIVGNNDDFKKFNESLENYLANLDIDLDNLELTKENAELFDFFVGKSIEKFSKELDNLGELNNLKLGRSAAKLALGDTESARSLVMDVINSGKMNDDRVDAFIMLRNISEKTGNLDESSKILDEAMNGDVQKINELKEKINKIYEGKTGTVKEFTAEEKAVLTQFSDVTFYYDSLFKNLRDVYGETYENGVMNRLRDIMRDAFNFYNGKKIKAAIE